MKNSFSACLRYTLYRAAISPVFYISALIVHIFCTADFFLRNRFFLDGTVYTFFLSVPYVCIALIPSLSLLNGVEDDFFPLSAAPRIFADVFSVAIEFSAQFLPAALNIALAVHLFGDVPVGGLATGCAIIILYALCAAAICSVLKASARSPAAVFLSAAALLTLMNVVHLFPPSVPFVHHIGFYRHFYSAVRGIFDTRDVFFYLLTALLFTALALFIYERRMGRKFKKMTIFFVAVSLIFAFLDSEKYFFRADTTGKLACSPFTHRVLHNAESLITLTYYRSAKAARAVPQFQSVRDYLFEFAADKNVTADVKDADTFARLLENYGIAPYRYEPDDQNQLFSELYSAIVIEYDGKWDAVPLVLNTDGLEYELIRRILRLITNKERIVNLILGGMDLSDDYALVIAHLNAKGFIVNEINLEDGRLYERLKAGGKLALVLGAEQIREAEAAAIEEYLLDGGNVFFAVSPFRVHFKDGFKITKPVQSPLLEVLESYGFGFSESIIADASCASMTLSDGAGGAQRVEYPFWLNILPQKNASSGMTLFWANAVTPLNENIQELVATTPRARLIEPRVDDIDNAESLFETNPFALHEEMLKNTNEGAVYKTAFELDGAIRGFYSAANRQNARLVLVPEPYFVSAAALAFIADGSATYGNFNFLAEQLLRLNGEDELAALHAKSFAVQQDAFYKTPTAQTFSAAQKKTFVRSFVFMPLLIIAAWLCSLLLRRHHIRHLCAVFAAEET